MKSAGFESGIPIRILLPKLTEFKPENYTKDKLQPNEHEAVFSSQNFVGRADGSKILINSERILKSFGF